MLNRLVIPRAFDAATVDRMTKKLLRVQQSLPALPPTKQLAAVLVPFCVVDNTPSLLYTLRASSLRKHTGEVSFPGGKVDAGETTEQAALREFAEELGVEAHTFGNVILGRWHSLPNKDGTLTVVPHVACLGPVDLASLNRSCSPAEVEQVFAVPLTTLVNPAMVTIEERRGWRMPRYHVKPVEIWGLTAYVTGGVLDTVFAPPPLVI